jgi:hypothetical protein
MSTGGKYGGLQSRPLWDFDPSIWGHEERLREALHENYNRHIRIWARFNHWRKSQYAKRVNEERLRSYRMYLHENGNYGHVVLREEHVFLPKRKSVAPV